MPDPSSEDVQAHLALISDPTDVPILLSAMEHQMDFLVTLNRRHFLDDARVAARSGLRIGNPGDVLAWLQAQLAATDDSEYANE